MTETDGGLGLFFPDGQEVAPPPQIVALALDELACRLARLARIFACWSRIHPSLEIA